MSAVESSSTPGSNESKEEQHRHNSRAEAAADDGQVSGGTGRASGRSALPCLYSNNSVQGGAKEAPVLTGGHRRTAYVLAYELKCLVEQFGLENCGFLTLTVGDKTPPNIKELQRRYNSLRRNVIAERYPRGIFVVERGENKRRLHLHGVVVVGKDIRTGFDFEAVHRRDYRSANETIRSEWAFWRSTAPRYGFGRTELLPVKSTAEGIARYVGSYIKKQLMHREESDRGARCVRFMNYGPGDRKASSRFAWASENAWLWRHKVAAWAREFGMQSIDEITARCGPRWARHFMEDILAAEIDSATVVYPSRGTADQAWNLTASRAALVSQTLRERQKGSAAVRTVILKRGGEDYESRPF